jgi:hypothetical protein
MEDFPAMSRANDRGYGESRHGRITLLELTAEDMGGGDNTCATCLEKTDGDVIFMVYICTYYIIGERLLIWGLLIWGDGPETRDIKIEMW